MGGPTFIKSIGMFAGDEAALPAKPAVGSSPSLYRLRILPGKSLCSIPVNTSRAPPHFPRHKALPKAALTGCPSNDPASSLHQTRDNREVERDSPPPFRYLSVLSEYLNLLV